jgi:hypothetical protein
LHFIQALTFIGGEVEAIGENEARESATVF